MKVALASDHAGLELKRELLEVVRTSGAVALDLGPSSAESVDYPDYAALVARALLAGDASLGVLVCGTGTGMSIAANKHPGIRAALCRTEFEARMARAHNDANVLCLGQRVTGVGLASSVAMVFLQTRFEGGRHARRLEKLHAVEKGGSKP